MGSPTYQPTKWTIPTGRLIEQSFRTSGWLTSRHLGCHYRGDLERQICNILPGGKVVDVSRVKDGNTWYNGHGPQMCRGPQRFPRPAVDIHRLSSDWSTPMPCCDPASVPRSVSPDQPQSGRTDLRTTDIWYRGSQWHASKLAS